MYKYSCLTVSRGMAVDEQANRVANNFNCKLIIIEGITSSSIQGVNLRERIEKFVKTPIDGESLDIKGKVRNLKNGKVEVICFGKDVQRLYNQIAKWKEKPETEAGIDCKDCRLLDYYDDEIVSYTDFVIERSDDQSEMVWALRGAGNRFAESTKELRRLTQGITKIHDNLLDRDKKLVIGRLLTLHYELIHNLDQLADPAICRGRINLDALKSNIESPAIPEQAFAHNLSQVLIGLQDLQRNDRFESETIKQLKEDTEELRKIVDAKLLEYNIKI